MKKILLIICTLFVAACGSEQTLIDDALYANSEDPSFITLYAIDEDNLVQVEIPLATFGDTAEDTENAMIDISINDEERHTDLIASEFFADSVDLVAFYVPYLEDGDSITFNVTLNTGGEVTYMGTISASEDSVAPLETVEEETE